MRRAAAVLAACLAVAMLAVPAYALDMDLSTEEGFYRRFRDQGVSINVYNWGEYISDGSDDSLAVNNAFQELTGIRVNYTNFATNEELYSRLRSGNFNYDVIIPSDYMIGRMAEEGMLLPLDYANIPNRQLIDESFLDPIYDPGDLYSVPYTWGYVGVIYNKDMIIDEEELGSWDILWNEKYLGNILMFSNSRDAFAIAQARRGYSLNTTDPEELEDCLKDLKEQKPLVQAYVMDEIFDKMQNNEAVLAPYYAGDAVTMMADNEDLGFFIPREGTNKFVDAMCIPVGSRQKEAAELYINFMLEPEVAAANAEYIGYASPNNGALELLDEEITGDEVAYPPEEDLAHTEYFAPLPQDTSKLMDQYWTELLSNDEQYNRLLVPLFLLAAVLISIAINVWRAYRKNFRQYF